MLFRWINEYCSSKSVRSPHIDLRTYVLIVADDHYLDWQSLMSYVNEIDADGQMTTYERRTFLTGSLLVRSRPQRSISERRYVSIIDYPFDLYPPLVSTRCLLMTRYNARLTYLASHYTRLVPLDDVYLGLLAYAMSTKPIENNRLFSPTLDASSTTTRLSRWKIFSRVRTELSHSKQPICVGGHRAQALIHSWNEKHSTNFTLSSTNLSLPDKTLVSLGKR